MYRIDCKDDIYWDTHELNLFHRMLKVLNECQSVKPIRQLKYFLYIVHIILSLGTAKKCSFLSFFLTFRYAQLLYRKTCLCIKVYQWKSQFTFFKSSRCTGECRISLWSFSLLFCSFETAEKSFVCCCHLYETTRRICHIKNKETRIRNFDVFTV